MPTARFVTVDEQTVLVDKDPASAVWDPPTLDGVSAAAVEGFFAPLEADHPRGELVLPKTAAAL